MKKILILAFTLLISGVSFGQMNKRIVLRDSSFSAFIDANRALREYGFQVVDAKKGKWVILENTIMNNLYQVVITYKGSSGILVESYAYRNNKKSWTNFETMDRTLDGIEILVRSEIIEKNLPEHIKKLRLMDTPLWINPKEEIGESK